MVLPVRRTQTLGAPFDPYFPKTDIETQRFAADVTRLLNRPHRNEFPVAIMCEDPIGVIDLSHLQPTTASTIPNGQSAMKTVIGWSPPLDGLILRRVRIAKANVLYRGPTASYVTVRALVGKDGSADVVGSYDSREATLQPYQTRVISTSTDIARRLEAGCVFAVEVTQVGFPKVSVRDATVFFDVFVT